MAEKDVEIVWPDLVPFYDGKVIFITGATGFLGKVLVEKLLFSCSNLKKIYILVRPSKKTNSIGRLSQLMESKVFDRIKEECPDTIEKLIPIPGDITLPNSGISESDLTRICEDVSIVFHVAATVRFDETPRKAMTVNLLGTWYLLQIAQKMKNLEAFIHVSTAYSFCNNSNIEESLYSEKVSAMQLISILKTSVSDKYFDFFLNRIITGRPYVYHFSKAMAEHLLSEVERDFAICIIRPSIVTASLKDPFPGWIDSYNGPSGMIVACGKGIIRTVFAYPDVTADFIPVDVVANTMIAAARVIAIKRPTDIIIINCTSAPSNALTWGGVEQICYPLILKYPSAQLFRHPGGSFKNNYLLHHSSMFFSHFVPACLTDIVSYPIKNAPRMIKIYKMVHKRMKHFEFFTINHFKFERKNFEELWSEMSDVDKEIFPFDMTDFSWNPYMDSYVLGTRRYLLSEKDESLQEARVKMKRTYYTWLMLKIATLTGFSYLGLKFGMKHCISSSDFQNAFSRYLSYA